MIREQWSASRIIAMIQELHARGETLSGKRLQRHENPLYRKLFGATPGYFDGWRQAIEIAGIDYRAVRVRPPCRRHSKRTIIAAIRKRVREHRSLFGSTVQKEDYGLYKAARRYFGKKGWRQAVYAAGYDPRRINSRAFWTQRIVQKQLRDLRRAGIALDETTILKIGLRRLVIAACDRFGSWRKAVESIGVRYSDVQRKRYGYWNPKRVLAEIRRLKRMRIPLHYRFIADSRQDILAQAMHFFGGWGKAVDAAGIPYHRECLAWSRKAWLRSLTPENLHALEQNVERLAERRGTWKQ